MMSGSDACSDVDWNKLVKRLRQDRDLISLQSERVRQGFQSLNSSCDALFQTLWVNHALSFSLSRVLSHRLSCSQWATALSQADSMRFTDAAQLLTAEEIRAFSTFLINLLQSPLVVSELLHQADIEGLDTARLASDLLSAVYSHCVFDRDHAQLLKVLEQLLIHHVGQCTSANELFGGVEPVFSRVLLEYCTQLQELKVFLTHAFQDTIMEVLQHDSSYLEFDVSKAGTRAMAREGSDMINVGDVVASSCQKLGHFCTMFLLQLEKHLDLFPPTLRWLLCSLKRQIHKRWPKVTPFEVRRPLSYVLFGFILSSTFINPDLFGILDRRLVLTNIGRYNLNQVGAVLQGCAWIIGRPDSASSYYSMQKVVKLVDMSLFISVVDNIDNNSSADPPLVPSLLPGLNRCFSLTSRRQLDELIAFTNSMLCIHSDFGQLHLEVNKIMAAIPQLIRDQLICCPYSYFEPLKKAASQPILDMEAKFPSSPVAKSPLRPKKKRSGTVSAVVAKEKQKTLSAKEKSQSLGRVKKSPSSLSSGDIDTLLSPTNPLQESFSLPEEVLILPVVGSASINVGGSANTTFAWELEVLTEEEFFLQNESHASSSSPLDSTEPPLSTPSASTHSASTPPAYSAPSLPPTSSQEPSFSGEYVLVEPLPRRPPNLTLDSSQSSNLVTPSASATNHSPTSSSYSPVTYDGSTSANEGEMTFSPPEIITGDSSEREGHFVFPPSEDFLGRSDEERRRKRVQLSASCEVLRGDKAAVIPLETGQGTLPSSLPSTPGKKKRGIASRIKDKLRFRKKSSDNSSSSSLKSSSGAHDIVLNRLILEERNKPRSTSDVTEWQPFSPLSSSSRPRSYTKLTSHITDKYRALSSQRKVAITHHSSSKVKSKDLPIDTSTTTPNHLALLTGNVETFQQCLMFRQLKYKLATALQSIHLPLLELKEEQSCKKQLVETLTSALQHSMWVRSPDVSLLNEIIRTLEPLREEHVAAVLSGIWEDHKVREGYLSYLTNLQQLCHDTTLQVAAIQHDINRSREVAMETFVHFVVQLFLEGKHAKLQQLSRDLKKSAAADIGCAMMDYLDSFRESLESDPCWLAWSTEDMTLVYQCLEDHLFSHVYSNVFYPNGDSDKQRDQLFSAHLTSLSPQVTPQHQELKILPVYHASCPWPEAQKKLLTMDQFKSPEAKLMCVVECCRLLIRLLQLAKCGDPPGADDTFPALIYIVIKANPPSLLSTVQYIQTYCDTTIAGEEAYWWTQFMIAVECTKTPGFTQ